MKNFYPAIFAAILTAVTGNVYADDANIVASKEYVDALTVKAVQSINETIEGDISGVQSSLTQLQGDVEELQEDVGELQTGLDDLRKKTVGDGEEGGQSLSDRIDEAKSIAESKQDPINATTRGPGTVVKSMVFEDDTVYGGLGTIGTNDIDDGAITTKKIADSAVTTDKLADDAVTGDKIKSGAVDTKHLATDAVKEDNIANGAITTDKVKNGAITGDKIAEGAIDGSQLGSGSITNEKLASDAVTEDKIKDGAVTEDKLGQDVFYWIDGKQDELNASNVTSSGTGVVKSVVADNGTVTVSLNTVDEDDITDAAVTASKIAAGAVSDVNVADNAAIARKKLAADVQGTLNAVDDTFGAAGSGNVALVSVDGNRKWYKIAGSADADLGMLPMPMR